MCRCLSACWHAASSPLRTGSRRPPSSSVCVTCVCVLSVSLLARRLVPVADREPTSAFQLCLCDVCVVLSVSLLARRLVPVADREPTSAFQLCLCDVCVLCCLSACWHAASSPSRTGSRRPPSNSVCVTCLCVLSVSLLARRLVPVADREPTSAFQLCLCDVFVCVVCQPAGAPPRPRGGQGAHVRLPALSV